MADDCRCEYAVGAEALDAATGAHVGELHVAAKEPGAGVEHRTQHELARVLREQGGAGVVSDRALHECAVASEHECTPAQRPVVGRGRLELHAEVGRYAKQSGLDSDKLLACLQAGTHTATVQKDIEAGRNAGMGGTPGFYVNGVVLNGAQPIEEFSSVIDAELAR